MSLPCADIESLVQTYLDDELAGEETRELERHVAGCGACRQQLAEEARFHTSLRKQLAPPRAPASLHGRIAQALDRADRPEREAPPALGSRVRRGPGSRWSWALPGAATMAAAAAMLLFVFSGPQPPSEPPVTDYAVRQHMRRQSIEVQGTAISPWIRRHFSPQVQVPRFEHRHIDLRGARLSHVLGRDAVQVYYDVSRGRQRHEVSMLVFDASGIDFARTFRRSQQHGIDGRALWLDERMGYGVVAHKSRDGIGYLLISDMRGDQLVDLVRHSDLLTRRGR